MRVFALVSAFSLLLFAACGPRELEPDHQAEWRDVLRHKKAAVARGATAEEKQRYADSVRAFLQKHPNHSRAREVWQRIQLEFADDLAALGRYKDAIRFYRSVLAHDPQNEKAQRGLAGALDRLAVTREKLLALEKGMSHREVASILGKPIPGWTVEKERPGATMEAWYYRMQGGGLAAVYFRNGKVLAAETTAHAPLGRLGS
ncbi:MAG TPA: tetratricopeptide repeat protein [Thermoanaerobaculia bacterium]|nr:tetratricopeptide repeat protein [Thermoanaerobaculia bacterium]